jgi:hypothetical protein
MANVYKRTFKVKYITHYGDYAFHDGIQLNQGKFYVEASDVQEAIDIVVKKLNGFLGETANVYIFSVKEVV